MSKTASRKTIKKDRPGKPRTKNQNGYSKFRTRWRHVLLIDQQIRSGKAPNCRQLASELEVSRRTILRDIDFLRYDLGGPVEYDASRRGYIYTEPNWDMPGIRITEGELFALMVAEKALEAYAGTPWVNRLQQVFNRMIAGLPDRIEIPPQELLHRISFDSNAPAIVDPSVLEILGKAVQDNRTLRMTYRALDREREKTYTIDPYVLRQARGAWYLAARDHRSGRVPMFNLSRIRKIETTEQFFDYELSEFDSKEYFSKTFGAYETSQSCDVVIEFSGWAAQLVSERRWHESQKLKDLPGGRLRFEIVVSHLNDIWPWVLSWGGEAKVIKPKELVEIVNRQAAATVRLYRKKRKRN